MVTILSRWITRMSRRQNNREKAKGGVATVVSNYLQPHTVRVCEGKEEDEYIITRLDHVVPPINIVNIYGQQESRAGKEQIFNSWVRLGDDLCAILARGEALLILGDMNIAVGSDDRGDRKQ
jgi:exonuclease III